MKTRTLIAATVTVAMALTSLQGWADDDPPSISDDSPSASTEPTSPTDHQTRASAEPSAISPTPQPAEQDSPQPGSTISSSNAPASVSPSQSTPLAPQSGTLAPPAVGHVSEKMIGDTTYVWGMADGAAPGSQVWTERKSPAGKWKRDGVTTVSQDGSFQVRLYQSFDSVGHHHWRVHVSEGTKQVVSKVFEQHRFARPTANAAAFKATGANAFTWGTVDSTRSLPVWTEARLGDQWTRSQMTTTHGGYSLPLTYAANSVGTVQWRVAAYYGNGYVVHSKPFSVRRVQAPTASSADRKVVGLDTWAWGRVSTNTPVRVRTEALLTNGQWATSQRGVTNNQGGYSIKLTFGWNVPGTHTFRIAVDYPEGTIHSAPFRLIRVAGAAPVVSGTTASDLSGYHHAGCPMKPSRLRTIDVNYWDYNNRVQRGTIVVRDNRAHDVAAAFTDMFNNHFYIAQMRLPSAWKGSDTAMMTANNTSAYNCRKVTGNPYRWSPHAYGYAVDINPAQNPYLDPKGKWWPSSQWSRHRPAGVKGMHYAGSTSVRAFTSRGWKWFSGWDWHHFERR